MYRLEMEKKIIALSEEGNAAQISQLISSVKEPEINRMIETCTLKSRGNPLLLLGAVFTGLQSSDDSCVEKKLCVFKFCINLLERNEINNKLASDIVGLLMLEIDNLSPSSLAALASFYMDSLKNGSKSGKALELFPKVLSCMNVQENIAYEGKNMKGSEYKSHVLNSLCGGRWLPQAVIGITAMFRDVPLTVEELRFVIDKVMRSFKQLDLQDLPTLVYQLLLLANKGQKRKVLEGIICHFIEEDKNFRGKPPEEASDFIECNSTEESLRQTESTCILHICFAIKQDQDLGCEFVKLLKSSQWASTTTVLAAFNLALMLSVARIHRFTEQLFDFIKTAIVKNFKDVEKLQQSHWLREVMSVECNAQDLLYETVQNSVYGWDHVVQGLVQLGFLLMDTFSPRSTFGRSETFQNKHSSHVCKLGAKILLDTFKAHEEARAEILDQIFNRVITKATSSTSHYLELLSDAVKSAPEILLASSTKVRESFDYLSFLTPVTADALLNAIQPLLKLSMSLKDTLILVLRKAMFSRQLSSRKIGVKGFLMILQHFKVLGGLPSSQTSQPFSLSQVQVHVPYNASSNEGLCLEVLGNLRRCLTHQADVRLLLYQGLFDVMNRNTQLREPILDLLLTQVKQYYEDVVDVNPPVKLELCICAQGDQVYLTEPFGHLLCCIQQCLTKSQSVMSSPEWQQEHEEPGSSHEELQQIMDSLVTRMIKSDLEDFELDKSADFSLANSVGVKNNIFAILVSSSYEVLLEYHMLFSEYSEESCEAVLNLFDNYSRLGAMLQEKITTAAGKKGKPSGKSPVSMLSIGFVCSLMEKLLCDTVNLEALRANTDFLKYLMNAALQKLQQIQDSGRCDGTDGHNKKKVFKHCCTLARVFLQYYSENQQSRDDRRKEQRKLLLLCLEGLETILNLIKQHYPEELSSCLLSFEKNEKEDRLDTDIVSSHVKKFQRLAMNILSLADDERNLKEVTLLLNIISLLSQTLPVGSSDVQQVYNWVEELCTEQKIDDVATSKLLLSILLTLNKQLKSNLTLLRDLSQDIHSQIGDIEQDVDMEDGTHFALITQTSAAPMALLLVLQNLEQEMTDVEWIISRLREDANSSQSDDSSVEETKREGNEKLICTRLGIMINAFHELVQSSSPMGICVENLLKQLTKLYGTLTMLSRYYLMLYSQAVGHLSSRFEKLIKLSGTQLTPYCYSMITYVQTCENEKLQHTTDKVKKNKKKLPTPVQTGKARVLKQSKTIPNLIFAIEQYEKYLIQLSKKSKVNLMEHIKLGTSRDFRINAAAIVESDSSGSSEEDEERKESDVSSDENKENENNETDGVPAKKFKLQNKAKTD